MVQDQGKSNINLIFVSLILRLLSPSRATPQNVDRRPRPTSRRSRVASWRRPRRSKSALTNASLSESRSRFRTWTSARVLARHPPPPVPPPWRWRTRCHRTRWTAASTSSWRRHRSSWTIRPSPPTSTATWCSR